MENSNVELKVVANKRLIAEYQYQTIKTNERPAVLFGEQG